MSRTRRLTVQTLEDRTVPSGSQALPFGIGLNSVSGTLNIIGNENEQTASVTIEGDQVKAVMMTIRNSSQGLPIPSTITKSYPVASVQQIYFSGRAEGDEFINDTSIPAKANGGDGSDELTGGTGNDTLIGGAGTDFLEGRGGDDDLRGWSGNDWFLFNPGTLGTDTIDEDPSEGNDWLDFTGLTTGVTVNLGTMAVQTVIPNVLSLKLTSWLGIERVEGSDGADVITGNMLANTINGNDGNDSILGIAGNDVITGGFGNDTLRGGTGNDGLSGNAGDDDLYGEAGNDILVGFTGDNFLSDGAGNDKIDFSNNSEGVIFTSGGGNDTIIGSSYSDQLTGSTGKDQIDGGVGNDIIEGGAGNDLINASNGNDQAYGGDGNDSIEGGAGTDRLEGGPGNDRLTGGLDNDTLLGGSGGDNLSGEFDNDSLDGGTGKDTMDGGSGDDELYADQGNESLKNGEHVEIEVPDGSAQTDGWSCGPNSGSRLLRSYGYEVSYSKLRSKVQNSNVISQLGFGTPPPNLRAVMAQYKGNTQLKSGATFAQLLARLGEGRPVVALLGWGETFAPVPPLPLDMVPETMHYVCLTGFDMAAGELYYTDTNGESKTMSFATFQARWDWPAGPLAYAYLSALEVKRNTMIW